MLSYVHGFHAGNFADVHKHVTLCLALAYLKQKPAPVAYLDIYAGSGFYDLNSPEARKTAEAEQGIRRLWPVTGWPSVLVPYAETLATANRDGLMRWYPGSPLFASRLLGDADRLVLNELHPRASADLQRLIAGDRRVGMHRRDALEALVGLVPPPEKRGLVLIDPSYERKDEFRTVLQALERALQRWRTGIYLIWYPLLAGNPQRTLVEGVRRLVPEMLQTELRIPNAEGMLGSGLIAINPPWQLAEQLKALAPWFAHLGEGDAQLVVRTARA